MTFRLSLGRRITIRGVWPPPVVVAVAPLVGAGIGFQFGSHYVWADGLFSHYIAMGMCAWFIVAFVAVGAARGRRRLSIAVTILVVMISALVMLVGGFWAMLTGGSPVEDTAPAPGGRIAAVVISQPWAVDEVYRVTIRQDAGLLSRSWFAGCLRR